MVIARTKVVLLAASAASALLAGVAWRRVRRSRDIGPMQGDGKPAALRFRCRMSLRKGTAR